MALDTSGAYSAGDDLRVIKVLMVPFGSYTLTCVQNCMNQLEDMSPEAAVEVVAILNAYDAAYIARSTTNLADTEGKTLVRADVLEWQVNNPSQPSGPQQEMANLKDELGLYMAFCSCLQGLLGPSYGGSTPLVRS